MTSAKTQHPALAIDGIQNIISQYLDKALELGDWSIESAEDNAKYVVAKATLESHTIDSILSLATGKKDTHFLNAIKKGRRQQTNALYLQLDCTK